MTFVAVGQRLAATVHHHGLGAAAMRLGLAVARQVLVIERAYVLELTTPPKPSAGGDRLTRLATPDDIVALARDPVWDLEADAAELLERGHRCVLSVVEGDVAGYAWMNPHRMVIPKLRTAFSLRNGEAHIYKGFTHPHHRGSNLGVDRFAFWARELGSDGRPRRLLTDFAFDNFATLARSQRTGLSRVATGTYLARGDRETRLFSTELTARAYEPIPADLPHREH